MRLIELVLDEAQFADGVYAVSIVKEPAMEANFVALSKQQVEFKTVDSEKHLITGALLIPNKPIVRNQMLNGVKQPFYCYFSEATIERASQLFLKNGNQFNTTIEHKHKLEGLTMVESWVKTDEEKDKSVALGLSHPVGTWFGTWKVDNPEVWEDYIKTGKVQGFSIEGLFVDKSVQAKPASGSTRDTLQEIRNLIKDHQQNRTGI